MQGFSAVIFDNKRISYAHFNFHDACFYCLKLFRWVYIIM